MGDSDGLSLAANISAMVGLADVVLRSGKRLYDLYERCRAAPASRALLLAEISATTSIVAQARVFLGEYQTSAFAHENRQSLPQINTVINLIHQEFELLCSVILGSQATVRDNWFIQLTKGFRWALSEQAIADSCNRLHRLTASMIAALSVTGRCVYQSSESVSGESYC